MMKQGWAESLISDYNTHLYLLIDRHKMFHIYINSYQKIVKTWFKLKCCVFYD